MSFCKNNWKVFLSMTLSLIIVFFIIPFFATPGRLARTTGNFINSLSYLKSLDFSTLFTLKLSDDNNETFKRLDNRSYSSLNFIKDDYQATPTLIVPTEENVREIPNHIIPKFSPSPVVLPSKASATRGVLTKAKPTKRPKPSPTPLAPSEYLRPGTGLDDIFRKAGELSCVPSALLKAFVAQEAPGVLNWSDDQALFYNAYDWWHRVKTLKEVCAGYGWHPETGLVASDSLFANEKCKEPFSAATANDTYSQSLGATQMLKSYWEKHFKEKVKQKLKVSLVDRRVLIDSLVGFGVHLKEDTGYSGSCGNWDFKYVAKAACVNAGGTCSMYNYCTTICNNYNKFAKTNYACSNAANLFIEGSFCQFK